MLPAVVAILASAESDVVGNDLDIGWRVAAAKQYEREPKSRKSIAEKLHCCCCVECYKVCVESAIVGSSPPRCYAKIRFFCRLVEYFTFWCGNLFAKTEKSRNFALRKAKRALLYAFSLCDWFRSSVG